MLVRPCASSSGSSRHGSGHKPGAHHRAAGSRHRERARGRPQAHRPQSCARHHRAASAPLGSTGAMTTRASWSSPSARRMPWRKMDRHAAVPNRQCPADAAPQQGGASRKRRHGAQPRAGGCEIHDRNHVPAEFHDLAGDGGQQGAAAGDHNPTAGNHCLRLQQDCRGRQSDDARQSPSRKRHHALVRTCRGDQPRRFERFAALRPGGIDAEAALHGPDARALAESHAGVRQATAHGIASTRGQDRGRRARTSNAAPATDRFDRPLPRLHRAAPRACRVPRRRLPRSRPPALRRPR